MGVNRLNVTSIHIHQYGMHSHIQALNVNIPYSRNIFIEWEWIDWMWLAFISISNVCFAGRWVHWQRRQYIRRKVRHQSLRRFDFQRSSPRSNRYSFSFSIMQECPMICARSCQHLFSGLAQCTELCLQLRSQAGKRQVSGAKVGLQHNLGLGGAVVLALYKQFDSTSVENHVKSSL